MNGDNLTYFDNFGVKYFQNEIKKFLGNKYIKTNICRIDANVSAISTYFCIGFFDYMIKGETFCDYTNLFSPNEYEKNAKIMLKYFQSLET